MAYADLTYEAQLKFLCTRKVKIEILSSDTEGGQIRYNNYDNGTSVGKKKKKKRYNQSIDLSFATYFPVY